MFSISHRTLVRVFTLLLAVLMILMFSGKNSPASFTGSVALADASTPRSYSEFIQGAYIGALGRSPLCLEEQAEYDALSNAAATGTLHQEAERFVSTLFETQASFNDSGGTYCQSSEYEMLNPASCDPFINTNSNGFITDLYQGFLLREPESEGFNDWMDVIPTVGRKEVLNGFRFSIEFGILVDALYPGTRPSCTFNCPECPPDPCEGPNSEGHYSRLCQ